MSIFETLREQIPLDRIVQANGSGKAHCVAPDHQDNDPSMHLYEGHVHCFACGFHGDVVDVWAATHGFGQPIEAALNLAREYGVELPEWDTETQRKAQERREKEDLYLKQAQVCHRALEKHPNVREWWEKRGFGQEFQEKFLLGSNKDGTAAVIPFWSWGRAQGLIERRFRGDRKYLLPSAEELPSGYKPLFVPGPVRGPAFLVEGFIDALALTALGKSAIAVGGTNISEHQMRDLEQLPGPFCILPDADVEGEAASREWVRKLYPKALLCPAEYGDSNDSCDSTGEQKDVADMFEAKGQAAAEYLEGLKDRAVDGLEIVLKSLPNDPSKRRRLKYVRENVMPLILRSLEEKGLAALVEPTKDSEVLAALDDIAAATKLKLAVLKTATEEEAQRRLIKIANAARAEKEAEAEASAVPEESYAHLLEQGVLERYVKAAARMHGVVGDEKPMRLIALVVVGAQLDLLPNAKPLGPSMMLIADSGRGKNYLTDAVVGPLPPEWYLAFESASAASMYYQVEQNPDFLRHRFAYPNEAEATDMLVEFLRPMLSAGKAVRLTVNNTGANGANQAQELEARGPITTIIPTVRNKLDEQLQTRLLVAELEDYAGRVKKHAQAASKLLLPNYASADNTEIVQAWQAALRSLTNVRRVVFPLKREEFALDDDGVSHGARLWANLLGLMCTHAWLEQRNREVDELQTGERAIVAIPDDYEAAYEVFKDNCQRTVINLSDTHRKVLDALYDLQETNPNAEGFAQRSIAEQAGIKQGTVSKHKAFLTMSAKLVKETDHGLALVSGAEPSWWSGDNLMRGFPSPEQVRVWWDEDYPPPDGSSGNHQNIRNHRNTGNQPSHEEERIADTCTENDHRNITDPAGIGGNHSRNGDSDVIPEGGIADMGLSKPISANGGGAIPVIPVIPGPTKKNIPVSFDLEPGTSSTVEELTEHRERQEGPGEERPQVIAEGLRRLLKEHPEYRTRRSGQIACRLHMSRYTPFAPTDEEVEAAMKEAP